MFFYFDNCYCFVYTMFPCVVYVTLTIVCYRTVIVVTRELKDNTNLTMLDQNNKNMTSFTEDDLCA